MLTLCVYLQGSGVFIRNSGTQVTFQDCNIHNNNANFVRATCNHPIAPLGCSLLLMCLHCLADWRWRLHYRLKHQRHIPIVPDLLKHCFCTFCKTPPKRHRTRHHVPPHRPNEVLAFHSHAMFATSGSTEVASASMVAQSRSTIVISTPTPLA